MIDYLIIVEFCYELFFNVKSINSYCLNNNYLTVFSLFKSYFHNF